METVELLTRREVSVLSGASLKAVDKAVEQGVVPTRRRGSSTFLQLDEVPAVVLLVEVKKANVGLPIATMKQLRAWVVAQDRLRPGAEFSIGLVRITVPSSAVQAKEQARRYASIKREHISSDPEILGGEPVITGTRVPARTIARLVAAGESPARIAAEFPNVSKEACEAATLWAASNPKRGRPTHASGRPRTSRGRPKSAVRGVAPSKNTGGKTVSAKNARTGKSVSSGVPKNAKRRTTRSDT